MDITSTALDLFTYTPSPTTSTTVVSITCGDPPGVANSSRQATGHAVGDFAVYWCDLGYEPVGNTMVQCRSTGLWTIVPVCKGKLYITTLQIKTSQTWLKLCGNPNSVLFVSQYHFHWCLFYSRLQGLIIRTFALTFEWFKILMIKCWDGICVTVIGNIHWNHSRIGI